MSLWSVYCDNDLLYDARLPAYKLPALKLTRELNKADTLTFDIYPQHPNFDKIKKLKPTLVVRNGSAIVSKSRVLDDELGWENGKNVITEGPLAWLNDSIQRPFQFPVDDEHTTPADYFAFLINRHNAQEPSNRQFVVGTVTVTDPNGYISRSDTEYSSTWTLLKEGLLNTLGGYIVPRYVGDAVYLDYLADFDVLANQPVQFGLNLLALKTERKGADIATAVLPLGKQDEATKQRLTIESLPDSETDDICKDGDIVYSKAAETQFGARIVLREIWDDVTVDTNLLAKATAKLAEVRQIPSTVTISAADLSAAGYNFNTFSLGTYVDIVDDYHTDAHGLLARYLVKKITLDILNPANNTLTLGATTYSLTETNQREITAAMQTVEANVTAETATQIAEVERRNQSAIEQSESNIMLTVTESYYTKGETDGLVSAVATTVQQTADGIRIDFSNLQQDVRDVQAQADAKFNSLQSYIQMAGGTITLGEIGNEVTLKIENDRIGIYVNGVAMTYWTASDFVAPITLRIPVGGRLILGNFAFIPRTNGSLDFTWVGG
ncbi:MAG: phage tail protein [Ruminococcus sp.]|nr:phage tail protein [Ruminococcus sp.]